MKNNVSIIFTLLLIAVVCMGIAFLAPLKITAGAILILQVFIFIMIANDSHEQKEDEKA